MIARSRPPGRRVGGRPHHLTNVASALPSQPLLELTTAGVYRTGKIDKGKTVAYLAIDVLNLADDVADRHT